MITDQDLKEAWDEGTTSDIYKIAEKLLKERDAYREMAAKKLHEVSIGKWGIDSCYEITDAEAKRILQEKKP